MLTGTAASLLIGGRVVGSIGLVGLGLAGLLLVVFALGSVAPRTPALEEHAAEWDYRLKAHTQRVHKFMDVMAEAKTNIAGAVCGAAE